MNTTEAKSFDYQQHMKEHGPDVNAIQRGPQARQARRETTKDRITIRIDADLLEQFKAMVPEGRGYQGLINQALREWLTAQGINQLVRDELKAIKAEMVESLREHANTRNQ